MLASVALGEQQRDEDESSAVSILRSESFRPEFSLHGFADVTFVAEAFEDENDKWRDESTFAIGELDLYMVSRLSESISFLGEMIFEAEDDGSFVSDVERLLINYKLSDRWRLSAGRHHSVVSYWNTEYHHGLLLQPTIDRPEAVRYEDKGGIVPVHGVGLAFGGRRFRGAWTMDYEAQVSNGRGPRRSMVQSVDDENRRKALALRLALRRDVDPSRHLQFGPSFYVDEIPESPGVPGLEEPIDESIMGVHFGFRDPDLEVIAEYFNVRHDLGAGGGRFEHPAYYVVLTWRRWKWKPYACYDRMNLDGDDPYFAELSASRRVLVGARWDLNPFNALKLELRRDVRGGRDVNGLAVQSAFTF